MTPASPGMLRWRCRRGMRELDLLLGGWLERRWPTADAGLRSSFEWLLQQPDPEIASWLLGGARPENALHMALIDDIIRRRD